MLYIFYCPEIQQCNFLKLNILLLLFIHLFIHFIAPLQGYYSEALPLWVVTSNLEEELYKSV